MSLMKDNVIRKLRKVFGTANEAGDFTRIREALKLGTELHM
jgi:hypothetical protein